MNFLINLLVNGFAVFITAYLLSSGVKIDNFFTAIVVAVILGIVNTLIKPVLNLLFLPLNIITLGLFSFFLNGVLILLASKFIVGFFVANIWWAILFGLTLSLINWFFHLLKR